MELAYTSSRFYKRGLLTSFYESFPKMTTSRTIFPTSCAKNFVTSKEKGAMVWDDIPEEIRKMAEERAAARKEKNWKRSDELRDAIKAAGYILEDTPQGQKIRKNM